MRQALSKFTAAGSGVQFLHARVMVRGPGGAGKSATIEALAGKEFNASQMSTVGVGVDELELNHRELQLGRGDGVLKAYDRAAGEGEYVRAIAANAAAVLAGTATATGGSMLAKVEVRGGVHPAKLRRDVAAAKEASPSSVSRLRAEVAKASSPAAALSSPAEASSSSHTAEGGKRNARMAAVGHTVVAAVGVSNALLEPLVKKLLSVKASRIESQK